MIRQLEAHHLEEVFQMVKEVIIWMNTRGINQWDEIYPDKKILSNDIRNLHAYGYFLDKELCGYMTLNEEYSPEYNEINWKISGKFLIIHRLFIKADQQGKGIAGKMMGFAEDYAKQNHYQSIRLDAYSENPGALHLYENKEYIKRGEVQFRKGIFYCFEKKIS